jgi:hypothetical protein
MLKPKKPVTKFFQCNPLINRRHPRWQKRQIASARARAEPSSTKTQYWQKKSTEHQSPKHQANPPHRSEQTRVCSTSIPHHANTNNAVTELMSAKKPKPTPEPAEAPPKPVKRGFDARDGLGLYIAHPEQNPEGLVVEYDDDFVVIRDKFPKARYLY